VVSFTPHAWQLQAAEDYERLGGLFIGLDPGAGKSYALSRIAARCRRALVVAPAAAVRQTMAQFRSYGVDCYEAKDQRGAPAPGAVAFASYTWLTRAEQADFFERFAPTDVLMDEFHEARGLANSARKRLERYLVAEPAVRVAVSTASPMSGRLHDFAFGLRWALRAGVRGLVPSLTSGLDALDARLAASADARAEFRRRLEATPGVYLDVGDVGRYQGEVVLRVVRREPALVLPDSWETPSGFLVESAAHAAEVERQLAWGYYHDVDPRPSEAYVEARRAWGGVVRRVVGQGLCDTEYQVRALRPEAYALWAEAQRAEGPLAEARAVWAVTTGPASVGHVLTNMLYEPLQPRMSGVRPTLVWAHHQALQEEVSRVRAAPLFREGARAETGEYLPDYRGQLAVASIEACHQSLNLQHFSHNLVLEPPADPEVWKQLIGRTARQGQTAPRVTCDVVVNCPAAERALRSAIDRASLVYETTGKKNPLLQLQQKDW
jgi:hypothetical protein